MPNHIVETPLGTFYLGRNPSHYDIRNMDYLVADHTAMLPPKDNVWQSRGVILNQGETPSCVGHGTRGWEMCMPVEEEVDPNEQQVPDPRAVSIWQQAQLHDDGQINPNDGATIHGVAKALTDANCADICGKDAKPRLSNYLWAASMDEILSFVSNEGPMIIGVTWYNSMFQADTDGVVRVDPSSGVAGGHCVFIRGVSISKNLVGPIPNSWSNSWGKQGEFYIPVDQFQLLVPGGEFLAGLQDPL